MGWSDAPQDTSGILVDPTLGDVAPPLQQQHLNEEASDAFTAIVSDEPPNLMEEDELGWKEPVYLEEVAGTSTHEDDDSIEPEEHEPVSSYQTTAVVVETAVHPSPVKVASNENSWDEDNWGLDDSQQQLGDDEEDDDEPVGTTACKTEQQPFDSELPAANEWNEEALDDGDLAAAAQQHEEALPMESTAPMGGGGAEEEDSLGLLDDNSEPAATDELQEQIWMAVLLLVGKKRIRWDSTGSQSMQYRPKSRLHKSSNNNNKRALSNQKWYRMKRMNGT
jgi:hypothetical protein